ncbi:hypothetical protein BC941DRAFT_160892 [Chlamydoabsidia padenii]|nr:hypothetical protein BC941DRAFT_160892 [Chlamydoabsidia padenii]
MTAGYQAMDISPTTTNYSQCIKNQLDTLYDNDNLDILLHQFLDLTFSLYGQQESSSTSSLDAIRSVASLFVTFILRWPTKKDHALNTLLYYHRKSNKNTHVSFLHILWQTWLEGGSGSSVFDESSGHIMDHLQDAVQEITASDIPENWSVLYLLCEMHTRLLLTIGDHEFFGKSSDYNQLKLDEMITLSTYLKVSKMQHILKKGYVLISYLLLIIEYFFCTLLAGKCAGCQYYARIDWYSSGSIAKCRYHSTSTTTYAGLSTILLPKRALAHLWSGNRKLLKCGGC